MASFSGLKLIITGLSVFCLSGCKTLKIEDASPAIAVGLNTKGKSEIAGIINQAMPGANVSLADDILSVDNRLFIERKPTYVNGNPVQGRITEMPRKFMLYRYDSHCYLVDDKTDESYPLSYVECEPIK